MKAVEFDGFNTILAKDQPEYRNLPAFFEPEGKPDRSVVYCHELTFEELEEVIQTRRIYGLQVIGAGGFRPINVFVKNPLLHQETPKPKEGKGIEEKPTKEEIKELTKIDNVEYEEVIHEDLQMKIDDVFTLTMNEKEYKTFVKYAKLF